MSTTSLCGSMMPKDDSIDVDDEVMMKEHHLSKQRISELREIFQFIDRDNGGTVSGQELSTLIRLVSSDYTENQIKLLMNKADMNGDGEMGFDEFVRLLSSEPSGQQEDTSATREAFEVFDADNDGFITKSELHQVMTRIGHAFTDEEVEEMLAEADKDGDGRVTYEEFEAMLKAGEDDEKKSQTGQSKEEKHATGKKRGRK
ncbi:unnamed protein product [Calicophoron daubneyi]|uniref:EF-hand domain-containing protein n=1 Tax=Calicophoron daubneyi TaxID=300641 RepID=A0AAV2T2B2_CALDB